MSSILSKYEDAVADAHARAFPDLAHLAVECRPILDLKLGDLGTDLPTLAAAAIKDDAQRVGERIKAYLPEGIRGRAEVASGYLNFKLTLDELWDLEDFRPMADTQILVALGARPSGLSEIGLLRLLSAALCQRELLSSLNRRSRLVLGCAGERPSDERFDGAKLIDIFRNLRHGGSAVMSEDKSVQAIFDSQSAPKTFWIHPDFIPRSEFREFCRRADAGGGGIIVRCLERSWYSAAPGSISEREIRILSGAEYLSVIFYLAQDLAGSDLDLSVPALNESSNLWGFLADTARRFERWRYLESVDSGEPSVRPEELLFLRQIKFIKIFWQLAAERGEVGAFLSALSSVLRLFNARLNRPEARVRLDSGLPNRLDIVLLKGVFGLFKDIMARFAQLG